MKVLILFTGLQAQSDFPFTEIIYGREDGIALTMLQLKPTINSNCKAIIIVISGAWNSSFYQATTPGTLENSKSLYVDKGYTVFKVIVGSQ